MKTRALVLATAMLLGTAGDGALAQMPKPGGRITIGIANALRQLDPHKTNQGEDYPPTFWMYNGLTRVLRDRTVVPDLATGWKSTPDLRKWTVSLRKGVLFHNGREMVADDVVASFRRVQDRATGSLGRSMLAVIETIAAPDKYTVEFGLNAPYAEFPTVLGTIQAKIVPRDLVDSLAKSPVGTGPFKLAEFVQGDFMRLVKNDKYFVPGLPYLDEIVYKTLPEAVVAATALKRGEIDMFYGVPVEVTTDLARAGGDVILSRSPSDDWDVVVVHNKKEPYSNLKFRIALNYATDKAKVVETALFGAGEPVETPIAPSSAVFNRNLPARKQDIGRAKQLLAEAGYPNGIDLVMQAPAGRTDRERLALTVQEMWKPAGIRVKVERIPWDKFVAEVELKGDIYATGLRGRATIDANLYPWLACQGSFNMFHYCNPELDKLLDAGRQARTLDEQKKIYGQVQQMIFDNPPGVIAWVKAQFEARRKHVQGHEMHPLFGHLYMDSVWLAR
jgi:peptide/nickel transport system substrate-binding protein